MAPKVTKRVVDPKPATNLREKLTLVALGMVLGVLVIEGVPLLLQVFGKSEFERATEETEGKMKAIEDWGKCVRANLDRKDEICGPSWDKRPASPPPQ
jgi:hypothetical protein